MINPFTRHLYVRIWLAVLAGVAVLTFAAGWAWRIAAENERSQTVPREVIVRDANDKPIGSGSALRSGRPGEGLEFDVQLDSGQTFNLQVRPRPPSERGGGPPPWVRPQTGYFWLLGIVGLAVAIGLFPIVRRLTQRLEALQGAVQRWGEGDLTVRVPQEGHDELADLSRHFNAAAVRVEQLLRSHKSLLANASHELRSPLARIRMGLELLGTQSNSAARNEISRNIAELDQLIDEILLASRLDASEADVGTVEMVDLTGLAAEECARTGAELEAAPGSDGTVRGVPRLLRRAIRNLLENARRYGAGEVTVAIDTRGREALLRVDDRGPGVPAALRDRIFEPFYRLPGASEREGGVGLGLALVKSIVERHGGSVRCEDRAGGGASFVMALPRGQ